MFVNVPDLSYCFGCGKDNPKGLHLVNKYVDGHATMEMTIEKEHCGSPELLHGGITTTMMDVVMNYAMIGQGLAAVTRSLSIDFTDPGKLGDRVIADGWVEKVERRNIDAAAEVRNIDSGKVLARARGLFKIVDLDKFNK